MARTSYILIEPGLETAFFSGLNSGDKYVYSRVTRKDTLLSRKKKKGISARSLLPIIAGIWAGLSGAEQTAWYNAGEVMGLNGWQLFVADQTLRILNDLPGVATPSLLHQSHVGHIKITAPASEIRIEQLHPREYWVSRKVQGKKGMFAPVKVVEDFSLPLKISINYRANLTATGAGSFAKFYARVWHSYQGVNRYELLELNFDPVCGWKNAEATLSSVIGYVVGYELFIHLHNFTGDLFFDNIKAEHGGQNWARDTYCKNIDQTFTRAFYQIPENWSANILPDGAEYDSVYIDS